MKTYKQMNAAQLTKYILTKGVGEVVDFAADFDDEAEDEPSWWFGMQKITLFDEVRVVIGEYGLSAIGAYSMENKECLAADIQDFFYVYDLPDVVAVDISNTAQGTA